MDIRIEIEKEHSKKMALKVSGYILESPKRFADLLDLFLSEDSEDYELVQRSAYVISHCCDRHPAFVKKYAVPLIDSLAMKQKRHVAAKRNVLRVLGDCAIPKKKQGFLAQFCFDKLYDRKETVGVRIFAMKILYNISNDEPDLKPELKLTIEEFITGESAGFKSCGLKILKKLKREIP